MPPSVAPSQLPNDPAQAIKEPLGTIELGAFLDGCCTKSTQPSPRIQPKSLFIWNFPDRLFASRDCRLRVPLSVLSLSRLAARLESSTRVVESRRAHNEIPEDLAFRRSDRAPVAPDRFRDEQGQIPSAQIASSGPDFGAPGTLNTANAPYYVPEVPDRAPADICNHVHNRFVNIKSGQSAACGSPPRRAYRPYRRCGRVAEGGGLLNRYRVVKPYRGFESLRLRHPSP